MLLAECHHCFLRLDADCKLGPITASSIQSTSRQLKSCNCHGCTLQICVFAQSDSFNSAHLRSRYPLFRLLSLSAERSSDVLRSPGWHIHLWLLQHLPQRIHLLHLVLKVPERTVVWSANPLRPVYSWGLLTANSSSLEADRSDRSVQL